MNDNREIAGDIEEFMPPQMIMHKILCIGAGLILPLILIPIVKVTDFSEIVEEIAKAIIILFVILQIPRLRSKIIWTIVFAFSFGLSESIFYISRIIDIGNYSIFVERLFLTVPMHIVSALVIMLFGNIRKRYLIIGLILAIIIHLGFNHYIIAWF